MTAARGAVIRGALTLLLAGALLGASPLVGADEDAVTARAFEVRYRSLADAADLVGELLSADGTLTLKPRLKTLIVEDRESVLDRVGALLTSFDLPPRSVEITFSLFVGSRDEEAPDGESGAGRNALSKQVRGVMETLGDFTRWTSYEPLGSRAVTGTEGDRVEARLAEDYRIAFKVESVHETQDVVKFEHVTLERVGLDDDGAEDIESLFTTGGFVRAGKLNVFGAASAPDSKRALFLALQVNPR